MLATDFCTLLSRLFPYKCQKGEKLIFNNKIEIASVEY